MKDSRLTSLLIASATLAVVSCGGGGGGGGDDPGDGGGGGGGGGWTITTVDSASGGDLDGVGKGASLALDAADHAFISYYDTSNDRVKYATNASGSWVKTEVDSSIGDIVDSDLDRTSLALDSLGYAHVSYTSHDTVPLGTMIEYATNASGSWASSGGINLVETGQGDPSLALDSADHPYVSYYTGYSVYLSQDTGGGWGKTVIDNVENEGNDNAMVIANDKIHMVYAAGGFVPDKLRYATNKTGVWTAETVEGPVAGAIAYASLTIDAAGHAHAGYSADNALHYATNKSGAWVVTVVDPVGVPAEDTSIGVDSAGHVHISYHDGDYLKYATNQSGSWTTTVLDNSLIEVGTSSSLRIGSDDRIHIAYHASENGIGYLKYAVSP